jgi:hypothetical protein
MLISAVMRTPRRRRAARQILAMAAFAGSVIPSVRAAAQTASATTVSAVQGNPAPLRFINGKQVGPRPQNLNPTGISFSDCIQDMVLRFSVFLSGFDGNENMQVWATKSGSCATDSARAAAGSGTAVPSCWLVNQGITGMIASGQSATFDIRVQDIVGPQNSPPMPPSLVAQTSTACSAQSSFIAVPMDIWFVPVTASGAAVGTAFDYPIKADLVGPPPPAISSIGIGDTLLLVHWTANIDSDTGGYDIFVDPPPGTPVDASAFVSSDAAGAGPAEMVCPDAAVSTVTIDAASATDDASAVTDAASTVTDAATTSSDAGCFLRAITPGIGTSCTSTNLTSSVVEDASTTVITTTTDDAGNIIEGGTVVTGTGGIATIDCSFLVGASCPAGQPVSFASNESVSGESNASFNVQGLTNGVLYNVAISAVDNFGNVGPPSAEQCQVPQLVDDFFKSYRLAGGDAGCALDAVGSSRSSPFVIAGFGGATIAVFMNRRRRKKRAAR